MPAARVFVWWCALLVTASPIAAQSRGPEFELSAGIAPTSEVLLESRPVAAVLRFGIAQRAGERLVRFRLDADAVFATSAREAGPVGALRAASLTYGVMARPVTSANAPYATAGIGLTFLTGKGDGWPGLALTTRTGAGIRWRVGGQQLLAEVSVVSVRSSSSILSRRALYWPIMAGIAF